MLTAIEKKHFSVFWYEVKVVVNCFVKFQKNMTVKHAFENVDFYLFMIPLNNVNNAY